MAAPPSLGDLKPVHVRVKEIHDLPNNRKGIVARFSQILESGGVQKVVVEMGQPIRVERLVLASDAPEEDVVPEDDILAIIRNHEVIEISTKPGAPFKDLFQVFALLTRRHLRASLVLVHHLDELDAWLELPKLTHLEELYGVEVRQSAGVEPETLLVVAADLNDEAEVVLTFKLAMELPK